MEMDIEVLDELSALDVAILASLAGGPQSLHDIQLVGVTVTRKALIAALESLEAHDPPLVRYIRRLRGAPVWAIPTAPERDRRRLVIIEPDELTTAERHQLTLRTDADRRALIIEAIALEPVSFKQLILRVHIKESLIRKILIVLEHERPQLAFRVGKQRLTKWVGPGWTRVDAPAVPAVIMAVVDPCLYPPRPATVDPGRSWWALQESSRQAWYARASAAQSFMHPKQRTKDPK